MRQKPTSLYAEMFFASIQRIVCLVATLLVLHLEGSTPLLAQGIDGGKVDGAIWKFTMTPKTAGLEAVNGRYRVSGMTLYQKENPDDQQFKRVVGKKVAGKKGEHKVGIVFSDFRARIERGSPPVQLNGSAWLKAEKREKWSGTFIDSDGRHWDFQCERIFE